MPSGVYERQRWMRNSGKLALLKEDIAFQRTGGATLRALAAMYDVSNPSIYRLLQGDWNPGRKRAKSNKELAELLDTTVTDIENRKKRAKTRLLRIRRRQSEGAQTHA